MPTLHDAAGPRHSATAAADALPHSPSWVRYLADTAAPDDSLAALAVCAVVHAGRPQGPDIRIADVMRFHALYDATGGE